ncbi:DNA adenine methylase [Desulfovibrio sp. OttesenSCG-928-G15]|nr:DNA adenine methylase [Desulfovibrio sp. OttesenSCG-928-G15]
MVKPYLKWAGGKRQLLQIIKTFLPSRIEEYVYYEPFVGAGAVLFELQPKKAVINDFNSQLILTYNVIKNNIDALVTKLYTHQRNNSREYYYDIRSQDRDIKYFTELSDVEKAARLIFMNKTCFNGLYRVNSQGLFNVPYGTYKNPRICEEDVLRAISAYLNNKDIYILNGDFSMATKNANNSSFIYFDPPYHSADNSNFTGYQAGGFGESEQIRLRDNILELTENGAKCLLSNSDTDFIREIYADKRFHIFTIQAKRLINSNSSKRGEVNEVLIKNWN